MSAPAIAGGSAIDLRAGPYQSGELTVVELRGREALSRLYSFDVLALCSIDRAVEATLLGEAATLTFDVPGGEPRSLTGIVAEIRAEGTHPLFGAAAYRLRVVPRMWLLRRAKNSRIFQDLTVEQIVTRVLSEMRVPCEFRLSAPLRPKAYCVQYQETDHDFVTRILAEEGIFFCFEPSGGAEPWDTVVFYNAADYPPIDGDPALVFRPESGLSALEAAVTSFAPARRVRTASVLLKDYDFQRPLLDLTAEARSQDPAPAHGLLPEQPRYYHPVSDYDDPEVQGDRAARLLSQLRRRGQLARGTSACRRLVPGRRFLLAEHPGDMESVEHAITRVEHEARLPDRARGAGGEGPVYRNTFECVPARVVYRPRLPSRSPRQVLETAIVVGPPGEVIHTDRLGRIKVQFHWDRDGVRNEHSSCWMRVSQAWAGPSWGFQFIPRIGMEVLVSFIGGDPDRPVVTGCLYNPLTPPSFDLPGSATKSGIRTRSVPGHDGHNELSFEDRVGQERIHLHAERDLEEIVKNDHLVTVGHFDPESPTGDQRVKIARDQEVDVGANMIARVSGNQEQTIVGDQRLVVHGGAYSQVAGPRYDRCEDSYLHHTDVDHQVNVGGDGTFFVGGHERRTTGADRADEVGGLFTTRVAGAMTCSVREDYAVSAALGVAITSAENIRLVCGDSSIDIGPREVTITSPTITVAATGVAAVVSEGVSLHLEKEQAILSAKDKVEIHAPETEVALDKDGVFAAANKEVKLFSTKGSSMVLNQDAAMDGMYVKLNCGGSSGSPEDKEPDELEVSWIEIELTEPAPKEGDPTQIERRPVPGARYSAIASNGRVYRGTLDGEGRARIAVPPGGVQVAFPDRDAGRVKPK